MSNSDCLDSLDRAVQEVEALQAIYDDVDEDNGEGGTNIRLELKSDLELQQARDLVEAGSLDNPTQQIPTLELELFVQHASEDHDGTNDTNKAVLSAQIYFRLPPRYPSVEPVKVAVLKTQGLVSRDARERLAAHLQSKAQTLVGSEAILEVTQECQEQLWQLHSQQATTSAATTQECDDDNQQLKRIFVWVHHITDKQRKEDIVREAQDHALGGYLKAGYPGVVVAEGLQRDCEEFIIWIKGNKSRPGGFGRQWGHHVRGELAINHRQLPETFVALEEDMGLLASQCRDQGLEEEFLRFVMQHG